MDLMEAIDKRRATPSRYSTAIFLRPFASGFRVRGEPATRRSADFLIESGRCFPRYVGIRHFPRQGTGAAEARAAGRSFQPSTRFRRLTRRHRRSKGIRRREFSSGYGSNMALPPGFMVAKDYVRLVRTRPSEVFVPLVHPLGMRTSILAKASTSSSALAAEGRVRTAGQFVAAPVTCVV